MQDPNSGRKYELAPEGKVSLNAFLQFDLYKSILGNVDRLVFDGGETNYCELYLTLILEYMITEGHTDTEILVGTNGSLTEYSN